MYVKIIIRNKQGKVVFCRTAKTNMQRIAYKCFDAIRLN